MTEVNSDNLPVAGDEVLVGSLTGVVHHSLRTARGLRVIVDILDVESVDASRVDAAGVNAPPTEETDRDSEHAPVSNKASVTGSGGDSSEPRTGSTSQSDTTETTSQQSIDEAAGARPELRGDEDA